MSLTVLFFFFRINNLRKWQEFSLNTAFFFCFLFFLMTDEVNDRSKYGIVVPKWQESDSSLLKLIFLLFYSRMLFQWQIWLEDTVLSLTIGMWIIDIYKTYYWGCIIVMGKGKPKHAHTYICKYLNTRTQMQTHVHRYINTAM